MSDSGDTCFTLKALLQAHPPTDEVSRLIGHSLGGIITLLYSGIYPDRVRKAVSIEGLGLPPSHSAHKPAPERMRKWIEGVRQTERREPRSYPNIGAAVERGDFAMLNREFETASRLIGDNP